MSLFDRLCLRLGRAAVLVAVVLMPLLLLEGVARVLHDPEPVRRVWDPFAYRIPRPGLVDELRAGDSEPFTVRWNELGMRGPSLAAPRPADAIDVVFLGGSAVENYPYPQEATFPELIAAALTEPLGRPVRAWNAGASGATSGTSLGRLQHQVLALDPALVVVMDGLNDLLAGFHPGFRVDGRHLPRPPTADARPRSYLLDWLRARRPRSERPPRPAQRVDVDRGFPALQAFERNQRSMAAVARAHGVPILFLTQPTSYRRPEGRDLRMAERVLPGTPPDVASLARGMETFNATVLKLDGVAGVHVFDLAARLLPTPEILVDECHFTSAGNRRVADKLVPVIELILNSSA